MAEPARRPLTAQELYDHPEYQHVIWDLKPLSSGIVKVAANRRGGPFNIYHEVHGKGAIKIVCIIGLGGFTTAWQRQTKDFGHSQNTNREQSPKYSVLVFDNRGMGRSDKPLTRYSTSEMAADVLEVVDHVGWKEERQLHVVGTSMGGMIAQELALLAPTRLASLTLICTGPRIFNTIGWMENLRNRINLLIPKDVDVQLTENKERLFSAKWLNEPDAEGHFPTNGDRFAAQELTKRKDPNAFTRKGFLLQVIAAGWHHKTPAQIKEIGDQVGRERIQVIHGTEDKMITPPHGEILFEEFGGLEGGVTFIKAEGKGHGLPMEWRKELTKAIAAIIDKTDTLKKK